MDYAFGIVAIVAGTLNVIVLAALRFTRWLEETEKRDAKRKALCRPCAYREGVEAIADTVTGRHYQFTCDGCQNRIVVDPKGAP